MDFSQVEKNFLSVTYDADKFIRKLFQQQTYIKLVNEYTMYICKVINYVKLLIDHVVLRSDYKITTVLQDFLNMHMLHNNHYACFKHRVSKI